MAIYGLSPIGNEEFLNTAGEPAVGWKLQFWNGGGAVATSKDLAGGSFNTATITLNSRGESDYDIFLDVSKKYTFKLLDENSNTILELVDITGVYSADAVADIEARVTVLEAATEVGYPVWEDTGTANAIDIDPDPAFDALVDGLTVRFRKNLTNTVNTGVTIKVNALDTKDLKHQWNDTLITNDDPQLYELYDNCIYTAVYSSDDDNFKLTSSGVEGSNRHIKFHRPTALAKVSDDPVLCVYKESDIALGPVGWVNHAAYFQSNANDTGAGGNKYPYQWTLTAIMNNGTTQQAAEQVAITGQANITKTNSSSTWAGHFNMNDMSGGSDPVVGQVSVEINQNADGTDANALRWGLHVCGGAYDQVGPAQLGMGVSIDNAASASWHTFLRLEGRSHYAAINSNVINATYLFRDSGSSTVGIDLSGGTYSSNQAIRLAANKHLSLEATDAFALYFDGSKTVIKTGSSKGLNVYGRGYIEMNDTNHAFKPVGTYARAIDCTGGTYTANVAILLSGNQNIAFENTTAVRLRYDTATSQVGFWNSTTMLWGINITSTGFFKGTTKILGARETGWTPFNGASDRASTFDVSTVSLPQLATRVNAIQAALTSHGLFGA